MMKEIITGTKHTVFATVTEDMLAVTVGSGDMMVYATPMMAALMEKAAATLLSQFLEGDETSVGTSLFITHDSPTPLGMNVSAQATVISAEGREITFEVAAFDESGQIGKGRHERFVVARERFQAKTDAKRQK